jgi:hypothetical protein
MGGKVISRKQVVKRITTEMNLTDLRILTGKYVPVFRKRIF